MATDPIKREAKARAAADIMNAGALMSMFFMPAGAPATFIKATKAVSSRAMRAFKSSTTPASIAICSFGSMGSSAGQSVGWALAAYQRPEPAKPRLRGHPLI